MIWMTAGQIGKLREELTTQNIALSEWKDVVGKKDAEIEEIKLEMATGLLRGFAKAKEQVKFLYLDLDTSLLRVYKVISHRELVEMSSSDDDDVDNTMVGADEDDDAS